MSAWALPVISMWLFLARACSPSCWGGRGRRLASSRPAGHLSWSENENSQGPPLSRPQAEGLLVLQQGELVFSQGFSLPV